VRGSLGRRVNPLEPDASLLLLKPAGLVSHGRGKRFDRDSWEYRVIREWVARGAGQVPGRGVVTALAVEPAEVVAHGRDGEARLRVVAAFADGSREDVTPFCAVRVRDEAVAQIAPDGRVRPLEPGSTAVTFTYGGGHVAAIVLVPRAELPVSWDTAPGNLVDRVVFERLRRLNVAPSEAARDAEFLRRVTIDAVGSLPSPDEIRVFLAEKSADKREKKIEMLLADPRHAALWATLFCDMTACNLDVLEEYRPRRAKMWHDWFRKRLAENAPYDQIVRGVLCADSRGGLAVKPYVERELALAAAAARGFESDYADRPGLDLFWRRIVGGDVFPTTQMAELTAAAFLGLRINCAQCHKHLTDRWTQADYRGYANAFAQVKFGTDDDLLADLADRYEQIRRQAPGGVLPPMPRLREVYVNNRSLRRLPDPETGRRLPPKALGGPELDYSGDIREQVFRWMVRPNNPFFARNLVNRVWKLYFGRGLVEPVDGLSASNPPSNPALLDALASEFVRSGYDIRHIERLVLRSRTYQLSSVPNETNLQDKNDFSRHYPRRPLAEVVVDMLCDALGGPRDFGPDVPPGARASAVAPSRVEGRFLGRAFDTFGRPRRQELSDCERRSEPAVPETLYLMSDPAVLERIRVGRVALLLARGASDDEAVEDLFLATLSRFPTGADMAAARAYCRSKPDRRSALEGLAWALINTREFILNH
jgi:hypothetical protein